ncbi:hypothetical protein GCM10009821_02700 [Aeromicrobium halocynthiae]|uniref:Ribbon-helix-helix protein, CopG family n=1 Tax=Aeromicrobium halocynthiae TaxID=560557 RepID=A0ABN2VRH5_9ACTN
MPRRVNMPGADELFRSTAREAATPETSASAPAPAPEDATASRSGSGRVKHDEKMTVYVTSDELLAIEQARLRLRRALGRNVDRGRLVRAALAVALEDLEARDTDSDIAERLREA